MKQYMPLITVAVIFFLVGFVSGCASMDLEESIGVGPDDNAVLRVRGETRVDLPWADAEARYCRAEFPANFDIATLTAEQLSAALDCDAQ